MPNSPRDAPQGARIPQRILLGGSKIPREFGSGVPKTGEAKFPMTPERNGTERNEWNERNSREKFTHRRVTANVCALTVCRTHTVPYKLQKSSMGSQESCL